MVQAEDPSCGSGASATQRRPSLVADMPASAPDASWLGANGAPGCAASCATRTFVGDRRFPAIVLGTLGAWYLQLMEEEGGSPWEWAAWLVSITSVLVLTHAARAYWDDSDLGPSGKKGFEYQLSLSPGDGSPTEGGQDRGDTADLLEEWRIVERAISPEELQKVRDLRLWVAHLDGHPACASEPLTRQAGLLLRFLRARDGDLKKAYEMLRDCLSWRHNWDVDRRSRRWCAELAEGKTAKARLFQRYEFMGAIGPDKWGLPVLLLRFAVADIGGFVREVGDEDVLMHFVAFMEARRRLARKLTLSTGTLLMEFVEVHDVGSGPRWWHRAVGAAPFFAKHAGLWSSYYPEQVKKILILRSPAAFQVWWRMVRSLTPPATMTKLKLYGTRPSEWLPELVELVQEDTLPAFLRDDSEEAIKSAEPQGGLLPDGIYEKLLEEERLDAAKP